MTWGKVLGVAVAVLGACASQASSPASANTPIDLGTLPGGSESFAQAVNASGAVAGFAGTGGTNSHAFYWTRAGGMIDLGTLGGESSYAYALNDSGQVVGDAQVVHGESFITHAFSWTSKGGLIDLGTFGGNNSYVSGVNDSGEVAGYAEVAPPESRDFHAFAWTAEKGMVDLGTLGGALESNAYAISGSGQIVGVSGNHAFSWTPKGGMIDLGTFPENHYSKATLVNDRGEIAGAATVRSLEHAFYWTAETGLVDMGTLNESAFSEALGISSAGQVVGYSWIQEGCCTTDRAFSWTLHGGMIELGTLGGQGESRAFAVDGSGEVVGDSVAIPCPPCARHAFAWTPQTGMIALGDLGGNNSAAVAINESGAIAGNAQDKGQHSHAALWLPTPTIAHVMPAAGPAAGDTTVTITGLNLSHATSVRFGSIPATSFTVLSETELEAVSPAGTGSVDITVTSPDGTNESASADNFRYIPAPTIGRLRPGSGPQAGGTDVKIKGTDFAGATEVDFGSTPASSFTINNPTLITAIAPAGSGTVDVTVTTPGGTSTIAASGRFRYKKPKK
jgi:probable HAF family extracellular repeat protein